MKARNVARRGVDTQDNILYTCVVPDAGSVSCTMLVDATRWWVCCCWWFLSRVCTEVMMGLVSSPDSVAKGSRFEPFSSTMLSIARPPGVPCKYSPVNARDTLANRLRPQTRTLPFDGDIRVENRPRNCVIYISDLKIISTISGARTGPRRDVLATRARTRRATSTSSAAAGGDINISTRGRHISRDIATRASTVGRKWSSPILARATSDVVHARLLFSSWVYLLTSCTYFVTVCRVQEWARYVSKPVNVVAT